MGRPAGFGFAAHRLGLALPTEFAFRTGRETYWHRVQVGAEEPPWRIEEHVPLKGRWLRAFLYAPGTLLSIFGIGVGAMAMIAIPLVVLLAAFASVFER